MRPKNHVLRVYKKRILWFETRLLTITGLNFGWCNLNAVGSVLYNHSNFIIECIMNSFAKIAKMTVVFVSIASASGCVSVKDMYGNIEKNIESRNFETKVFDSQELIVEARLLLSEGEPQKAKELLDKAYALYPRQASLHGTYQKYYEQLGDRKLARLAMARYDKMVSQSEVLNQKGRHAMVNMNALKLAGDLFNLSIIYHDENTSSLVNIATLGYTTGDLALAKSSLRILGRLGHLSPEASMVEFLVAQAEGDSERMRIVRLIMKNSWPDSPQYNFVKTSFMTENTFNS